MDVGYQQKQQGWAFAGIQAWVPIEKEQVCYEFTVGAYAMSIMRH